MFSIVPYCTLLFILKWKYKTWVEPLCTTSSLKVSISKTMCMLGSQTAYSEEHQLKRMACALDFLDRYHTKGNQLLENTVTGVLREGVFT